MLATVSDKKLQQAIWRQEICGFTGCRPIPGIEEVEEDPGSRFWRGPYVAYRADILSATDYYPFGMAMPGRQCAASGAYRYGFNGKERDDDDGVVQYDYGFRIYDPRLGRFKSVDPLIKSYPWYSPYHFAGNNPIHNIDLDGLEECSYGQRLENQWIPPPWFVAHETK